MTRVAFITLGCPKNEVDSERMRALVSASAYELVDSLDDADVAVVNTCGFITAAVEEAVSVSLDLAEWRDAAPGRRLIVAGCMVSRYGSDLTEAMPEADAFLPLAEEPGVLDVIERLTGEAHRHVAGPARIDAGPSAYLQVSDGCFRSCAYCTIPTIRGPYRSRPLAELLAEAALLVARGAREIVLIGQDISSWGRDLHSSESLADVIRSVAAIPDLRWLRLMYVQPDGITDDLLATMAATSEVCHYLDVPLQHASAPILRAMNRHGSAEEFLGLIERVRIHMPDAVLRTSLIAGYPGETADDVDVLLDFIEGAGIDYVGVFPFSPEEGTAAASLPGQVPDDERLARTQRVRDTADEVGFARAEDLVGRTLEVLSEGVDEDGVGVGRWRGQAPEVDGIVTLDAAVDAGSFVTCRITEAYGYDLTGEVLP